MKAMLLAAGKGERMRPLTDETPKPLLEVGGKPLLQHHIENLVAAGFTDLVVNVSWLGDQIEQFLQRGRWGLSVRISREETPLETAGGIIRALPLLGEAPFALVNGDVWTDYPFSRLHRFAALPRGHAFLVLVDNPPQHADGDFHLLADATLRRHTDCGAPRLTYAGIAVLDPGLFAGSAPGRQPLLPFLEQAMAGHRVVGERYGGGWEDVGTPERLRSLDAKLGMH